VVKSKLRREGV